MTNEATETDIVPASGARYSRIKDEAGRLKGEAATKARSAAEEGKAKAAETLGNVSQATRDAAEKLRGGRAEPIADYINSAADSIDGFAQRMQSKSVDDLIEDTREIVRRSPVVAIAIAAAAGFVISRFLRAAPVDDGYTSYGQPGVDDDVDSPGDSFHV